MSDDEAPTDESGDGPPSDAPADGPPSDAPADGPPSDAPADGPPSDAPADEPLFGAETDAEKELAPSVDIPDSSVDIPDASNASPELRRQFWWLVAVFNVAILAVSLGLMLVGFRAQWTLGGQLVVGGALVFAYGYYKYRKVAGEPE